VIGRPEFDGREHGAGPGLVDEVLDTRERIPPFDCLLVQVPVVNDCMGCILAVQVAFCHEEKGRRGRGCGGADKATFEKVVYKLRLQTAFVRT